MGRSVAAQLREQAAEILRLAEELEEGQQPANQEPRKRVKATALGHERAARALRKAGVYPRAAWKK